MKTMNRAPDMKLVNGNLFWLEKGVLKYAARNKDGTPDWGTVGEVELGAIDDSTVNALAKAFPRSAVVGQKQRNNKMKTPAGRAEHEAWLKRQRVKSLANAPFDELGRHRTR